MKRTFIAGAVVIAVIAAVLPVAIASSDRASATTVAVSGKEFSFKLSKKSGPHGTFIFKYKNVGNVGHDFKIAGKKTPIIQPGATAKLTVKIAKAGRYKYLCTVPGHAAAGMKGTFTVK
jgi:plastocyanin